MKSLEITTNKRLLIVEVSEDTIGAFIDEYSLYTKVEGDTVYYHSDDAEVKKAIPICRGSDLTEEIAAGMVDKGKNSYGEIVYANHYEDIGAFMGYEEALPSLISLIESLGWYWENPLGDQPHNTGLTGQYPTGHSLMDLSLKKALDWMDAESRTFHPEKCLIFEIVEGQS